jgi:hypothetical protein
MIQQPRLPYVEFKSEVKESKDGDGHIHRSLVWYAHVLPIGGKDEVIHEAESWLKELRRKGEMRGPFDSNAAEYGVWADTFEKIFKAAKANEEIPLNGTPLRACMAFTKLEVSQATSVRIHTLEDLASANEEAMRHMGIGARALKDKAVQLLANADSSKLVEENAALKAKMDVLEERIRQMEEAGLKVPGKPGRPRKVTEETDE